jgi:hypothetical protein
LGLLFPISPVSVNPAACSQVKIGIRVGLEEDFFELVFFSAVKDPNCSHAGSAFNIEASF